MKFTFKPEFKAIPVGTESQFHVLTTFSLPSSDENVSSQRTPISMALVIDRSGSMSGDKLTQTRNAICEIIHSLTRRDRLAIICFDNQVDIVSEIGFLTEKNLITGKAKSISAGGSTNLSGGWLEGLDQIEANLDPAHINRVFLLTDGQANCGVTDPEALVKIGESFCAKGITTSTFGFGNGFNERLLTDIAAKSGGNFYFIQKPEDVSNAFRCEFGEVLDLAAQNCRISIELAKNVKLCEDLSLFPSSKKDGKITWAVGDLAPELDYELVFRIKTLPTSETDLQNLFKINSVYKEISNDFKTTRTKAVASIKLINDQKNIEADEEAIDRIVLAKCHKARQLAYLELDKGQFATAAKILSERKAILETRISDSPLANIELLRQEVKLIDEIIGNLQNNYSCGKQIQAQIQDFIKRRGSYLGAFQDKKYIIKETVAANDRHTFDRISSELKHALQDLGLCEDFSNRCLLCFSEALANAVEHGCRNDGNGSVEIVSVFRRNEARIQIIDSGKGFNFEAMIKKALQTLNSPDITQIEQLKFRGRGIPLLLKYSDQLTYNNQGNEILLTISNKLPEGFITPDNSTLQNSSSADSNKTTFELKNHRTTNGFLVEIIARGSLDMWNAQQRTNLLDLLRKNAVSKFILNLENVDYIDSDGLSFFVHMLRLNPHGKEPKVIICKHDYIYNILCLIGMNNFFSFANDIEEALKLF